MSTVISCGLRLRFAENMPTVISARCGTFLLGLIGICLTLLSAFVHADVTGSARVIDGDTLVIGSQTIRLLDIDAPENGQDCIYAGGQKYNCGDAAGKKLNSLLTRTVECKGSTTDAYDRLLATCFSGGVNVNRAMVHSGHAVVFLKFSEAYLTEQSEARAARRGLWAGTFKMPWEFRAGRWTSAASDAPSPECPIKGNINRQGERIYHAPWSRSYSRTKIDTSKEERWFCSEAEALAAGWRAPWR